MTDPTKDDLHIADEVIASHLPPGHRREVLRLRVARAIAAERDRIVQRAWNPEHIEIQNLKGETVIQYSRDDDGQAGS